MNPPRRPDPLHPRGVTLRNGEICLGEYVPGLGFRVISAPAPITPEMQAILDEEAERLRSRCTTLEDGERR